MQRIKRFVLKYKFKILSWFKDQCLIIKLTYKKYAHKLNILSLIQNLKNQQIVDINNLYNKITPPKNYNLILEIGSGHGETAMHACNKQAVFKDKIKTINPILITIENNLRFYKKLRRKTQKCSNVLAVYADAYKTIQLFDNNSLSLILILFPDPWHKRKHQKRRPLNSDNLKILIKKLKQNGKILIASDHLDYIKFILQNLAPLRNQNITIQSNMFDPQDWGIPHTHYYNKWVRFGKESKFILITKN